MSNEGNSDHMKGCKERARAELRSPGRSLEQRIGSVIASLMSDFAKEPSTANLVDMTFMLGMTVKTEADAIRFIDGFNG